MWWQSPFRWSSLGGFHVYPGEWDQKERERERERKRRGCPNPPPRPPPNLPLCFVSLQPLKDAQPPDRLTFKDEHAHNHMHSHKYTCTNTHTHTLMLASIKQLSLDCKSHTDRLPADAIYFTNRLCFLLKSKISEVHLVSRATDDASAQHSFYFIVLFHNDPWLAVCVRLFVVPHPPDW